MPDEKIIAFIGGGMMAAAMIEAIIGRMGVAPQAIYVSEHKIERCQELQKRYQVHALVGAESFIDKADVVILAVKPASVPAALEEIKIRVKPAAIIVSIVAGLKIAALEKALPQNPLVRVMPNTPLAVGAGMSAYARNEGARGADIAFVSRMLSAGGRAVEVQEPLLDAVTGLSGSGAAYGFLMIEALSDGGVLAGLPRGTATLLAAQTLFGAAQMVLEGSQHPAVLREQVTSPGGTTIAGIRILEQRGVRAALMDAVLTATERSVELGKMG